MAAIWAARAGARTLLLEKKPSPGRKLLVSGSGRCNLSHGGPIADFLDHYGKAGRFLRPALYGFTNTDTRAFFEEGGVPILEEEGGKLFPVSGRARDLLDVLLAQAGAAGVEIRNGASLTSLQVLEPGAGGPTFLATSETFEIRARRVVLALGGASYPVTGSDGKGYAIPQALGHSLVAVAPALAPLLVTAFPVASLAGTALPDRALRVWRDEVVVARGRGDVLFTHRGLSGPGILDLSRSVLPGDELGLEVSGLGSEEIEAILVAGARDHGKRLVRTLCADISAAGANVAVPSRLLDLILERALPDQEARASSLSREARKELAAALWELRIPVAGLGGWDEAMATRGGISLEELSPKTLESRLIPGLFFAGEFLDLDGDTGGYNIQAAFSTGRLAGLSAARGL